MVTRIQETIWTSERLVSHQCKGCGIWFGMPEGFVANRKRDGQTWYCPNGHPWVWNNTDAKKIADLESDVARLRDNAEFWKSREATAQRRVSAAKGQVTKIKNRIANGVCPCCNRHFANVERHMKNQHPDFSAPVGTQE